MLFNRLEQQQPTVWLPTTIDLLQQIHGQSRASTEALSTTISATPTQPRVSPPPTSASLHITVLIRKSQMQMEDSQCLVSKAIGTLLTLMSSLILGSMAIPARFGDDVMEIVTSWTKDLCVEISKKEMSVSDNGEVNDRADKYLSSWNVLDLGTGNGLLLHQLAKEGFSDLTETDYSEGAVELAQHLSQRDVLFCFELQVAEASLKRVPLRFTLKHMLVMPHLSQETLQSSLLNNLRNEPFHLLLIRLLLLQEVLTV
ncbi:unnamed protein product [Eruca vesicaria subsp. sativa]|uniref:Methyltransferase domain-containing protein n=1 Tax=Eruca vesicaria subsp. sativa TaxID=29727 RepID=A0ABC8KDC2_ERUVS|nr:unnamed protein product [Eruca vesicaria subsp. sativa]